VCMCAHVHLVLDAEPHGLCCLLAACVAEKLAVHLAGNACICHTSNQDIRYS